LKSTYREVDLEGLFSGFLIDVFLFFFFGGTVFAPGAELGGRIDIPGIKVGVIPNAMVSSFYLIRYYITII